MGRGRSRCRRPEAIANAGESILIFLVMVLIIGLVGWAGLRLVPPGVQVAKVQQRRH